MDAVFQSTLPSLGATSGAERISAGCQISIHAPLAGSDDILGIVLGVFTDFNPRSPRGERRAGPSSRHRTGTYFNPRSPRGERPVGEFPLPFIYKISIHAPLAGSDLLEGALRRCCAISIHAPLAGSDPVLVLTMDGSVYFNPRSPRGERLKSRSLSPTQEDFNPRSPRGERHPLLPAEALWSNFNPRSPRGERPPVHQQYPQACHISIHAPLAGSDAEVLRAKEAEEKFQSTLPSRGATISQG